MFEEHFKLVAKLTKKGLLVLFEGTLDDPKIAFKVVKPSAIRGNSRLDYTKPRIIWRDQHTIPFDAPSCKIFDEDSRWILEVWEYYPGPGPGDFRKPYPTLEAAIDAVLEYYFGDPRWMNPPELDQFKFEEE